MNTIVAGNQAQLFPNSEKRSAQRSPACGGILGALARNRRGAASLVFTVGAITVIGLAGLATEGGTWYLEKRHGQNTADAAAIAGVMALAAGGNSSAAQTSGTRVATLNGYTTGVTINNPPASGTYAGNANAVEAIVSASPTRLFSALFSSTAMTISERAVALLDNNGGNACALSLSGGLSFNGNTTISAPGCVIASNNKDATSSISCGNSSSVNVGGLVASGGINSCSGTQSAFQPPTPDPFTAAQGVTLPPAGATCHTGNFPGSGTVTGWDWVGSGHQLVCSDITVNGGATVDLAPGTYVLENASLTVTSGSLICSTCTSANGVTIILTATALNKFGSISINGNTTVTLHAPPVSDFSSPAFDGVLFYMDKANTNTNGNPVVINGGANITLVGGMYFPSVPVKYSGNTSGQSTCTELVGLSLTFTGNSNLSLSGCAADGTPVALPQSVHLVM